MSLTAAQIQFAAEFVALVVAASALADLAMSRGARRPGRLPGTRRSPGPMGARLALIAAALMVLAAVSFAHGSLLVSASSVRWLGIARMCSAASLLVATPGAREGGRRTVLTDALLRAGLLAWTIAGAVEVASLDAYVADALLACGALLVASALVGAAQRSVAARVAAGGAATLLVVVVVLALALSTVISRSVQNQALTRLSDQAAAIRAAVSDTRVVTVPAQLVEADLAGVFTQQTGNPLSALMSADPAQRAAAEQEVEGRLAVLAGASGAGAVAYSDRQGHLLPGGTVPAGAAVSLRPPSCAAGRQGLFLDGGALVLGASSPECTTSGQMLGWVVSTRAVDDRYLVGSVAEGGLGEVLESGGKVLASGGVAPGEASMLARNPPPAGGDQVLSRATGGRLVSVAGLEALGPAGPRPVRLVLTAGASTVLSTRDQLFRTLFLIAFGGTLLALGLAVFTGDRITGRLRRLTRAAGAIEGGDFSVRSGVTGDDEIAAVGSAFDSMLDSVVAQSAALQAAVEDEASLRNRLEAVVAGMSDALVAVDSFGRISEFNRAAEALTGVDARRAIGAPAGSVIVLRDETGAPAGPRLLDEPGCDTALLARLVRDETDVPVAVSSGGVRGPGGDITGTVLVIRDMRREREVERMKTEFLSRVGHELRTPLTGIMGYADILVRREVPPARAKVWHEEILHAARRLLRIVEMLEFFASEGAGRAMLRLSPVDVRALVNGIAASWSERMPENLSLGRRICRGELVVAADRRWLTLAVDELVDNAVKFSPDGGRVLLRVVSDGEAVEISVTDQGVGMSPEERDLLFSDFAQGDTSDTRRFGGLGLGLAVVSRVVAGHGGTVRCRSAPGRGATFTLVLPLDRSAPGAASAQTDGDGRSGQAPSAAPPAR